MWVVEMLIGDEWENVWWDDANQSLAFSSEQEAKEALAEHLADQKESVEEGFLEDVDSPEVFRVVQKEVV
jgi:hypothetical protein